MQSESKTQNLNTAILTYLTQKQAYFWQRWKRTRQYLEYFHQRKAKH